LHFNQDSKAHTYEPTIMPYLDVSMSTLKEAEPRNAHPKMEQACPCLSSKHFSLHQQSNICTHSWGLHLIPEWAQAVGSRRVDRLFLYRNLAYGSTVKPPLWGTL